MSEIVLIPGFGGEADFEFLAPMLAREHSVEVVDLLTPLSTHRDTVVIGYSIGAAAAAAHAALDPVGGLVLICGWVAPTPRLREWALHAEDETFARHTMVGPESDREPLVQSGLLAALDTSPNVNPGDIACPTLVVGAAFDLVATVHQSRLLHGGIPGSRYAEVPTGHAALLERPAEILSLISAFLRQSAAVPPGMPAARPRASRP